MPTPDPRWSLWALRAVWLVLPVLVGPTLAGALDGHSRAVQVVASLLAWGGWGVGLVATLVPRSVTLTAVRLLGPGALAVAAWSAIGADGVAWAAIGVGAGAVVLVLLAAPGLSDSFVDGSSYGREQRVALRVPVSLLVAPVPLAWAAAAAGVASGPLLLATGQWVAGGLGLVVGVVVVGVVARQFHLLSRRWLVFVPAGVVVHDPLDLTEPILFQRHLVTRVGPAPAEGPDDPAVLDVTGGALGLVVEVRSSEPFTVGVRIGRDRSERAGIEALLVTPTQPAAMLAIAAEHRLPVR